ncbi:MAG: PriCT-2 domain-containing protein [Gammaproteobacteria bacterium]|nr:PriCT-2 domain-containing protein [Gammaproteobacteria bacterium]
MLIAPTNSAPPQTPPSDITLSIERPDFDEKGTAARFLLLVWGPDNDYHHLAFRDAKTKLFRNKHVRNAAEASEIAVGEPNSGSDVFFAPTRFKNPDNRKAENAVNVCCFWMDVDVSHSKAEARAGYETIEESLAELTLFCRAACIPEPTIMVSSGSGLHLYWVIDRFIQRELWLMLASKFKAIAKQLGFLADPSRTADIASLLRVPGTLNYKYSPPRPVILIHTTNEPVKLRVMADAITAAHDRLISGTLAKPCKSGGDSESVDFKLLQAILRCLDPDMVYTDWFKVGAAIFNYSKSSESGYQLFDAWSSLGQKYKGTKDTLKLWRSLRPDHPNPIKIGTLCKMVRDAGFNWEQDVIALAEKAVQS